MENFINIKGYKEYFISNLGRVLSVKRGKKRFLKPAINGKGYLFVRLYKNGKTKTIQIHQLVAMAFLNHAPNGMQTVINHKNFVKTDNRLDNLEVTTNRENSNRKHLKSTSKYTGVAWNKKDKRWHSSIFIKGKKIHLGNFKHEIEGAIQYYIAVDLENHFHGNTERFREQVNYFANNLDKHLQFKQRQQKKRMFKKS